MLKSKLYNNLVDATKYIVNQFGPDIIKEDRFSNIVSDICPDRNNPAIFNIIKSASQNDVMQNLLSANAKTIEHIISHESSILSWKYGYDSALVEGVLYSVSVGASIITLSDYNKITGQTPIPPQNISPKNISSKNIPSKKQVSLSSKQRQAGPSIKNDETFQKFICVLVIGIIGLIISPILYLVFMSEDWWPFWSSIAVAVIHLLTIVVPMSAVFVDITKKQKYPFVAGASNAILVFAIIFWLAFPFLCSINSFLRYFGIHNDDTSPWLITIFANLICAGVLSLLIPVINESISGINTNQCKSNTLNTLFNSIPYRKGFLVVCAIVILEVFALWLQPYLRELERKRAREECNKEIENLNLDIARINNQKDSLRNERSKQCRQLAFADFPLGAEYSKCAAIVNANNDYTKLDSYLPSEIRVKGIDYRSIIDQNLRFQTNWNNEQLVINLYFAHQQLIQLEFSPEHTNGDSIIAIYSDKYGEPEYHLQPLRKDIPAVDIMYLRDSYLSFDTCYWTYNNCMLEIVNKKNSSYYNYYDYYDKSATIIYFDRTAESYLQKKIEEEEVIRKIANQHRRDSLKQERKKEERLRREQREQEELNHQKSINQI